MRRGWITFFIVIACGVTLALINRFGSDDGGDSSTPLVGFDEDADLDEEGQVGVAISLTVAPTPASCSASITSIQPLLVTNNSDGPASPIDSSVVVTLQMSGSCEALVLGYDPTHADDAAATDPHWLALGGSTTMTIAGRGDAWSDGTHSIRLYSSAGGTILSSRELAVS